MNLGIQSCLLDLHIRNNHVVSIVVFYDKCTEYVHLYTCRLVWASFVSACPTVQNVVVKIKCHHSKLYCFCWLFLVNNKESYHGFYVLRLVFVSVTILMIC